MGCHAVHEPENPEYSILKQRLARNLKFNGYDETTIHKLTLIELTKVPMAGLMLCITILCQPSDCPAPVSSSLECWGRGNNELRLQSNLGTVPLLACSHVNSYTEL